MKHNQPPFWTSIARGLVYRCPNCGKGRLFKKYLQQVKRCESCNEELGNIRADDGPAWLTILVVGHILAPFLLVFIPQVAWPEYVIMTAVISAALALTFAILPCAKGAFIGMIWRSGCSGGEK